MSQKFPWKDLAFTLASGFVVQKIVDGDGMDMVNKLLGKGRGTSRPSTSAMPSPVLAERFGPHPFAIYFERVVWALTGDFDLERIRTVRNFLNQHEAFIETSYQNKVAPDELGRLVDSVMSGKATFPHIDPKAAFMARAERVLGAKVAQETYAPKPVESAVQEAPEPVEPERS